MSDVQTKMVDETTVENAVPETDQPNDGLQPTDQTEVSEQGNQETSESSNVADQPGEPSEAGGSEPADSGADQDTGHQIEAKKQTVTDKAAEQNKLRIVTKALKNIERDMANVIRLLESSSSLSARETVQVMTSGGASANLSRDDANQVNSGPNDGRVIEGVFDGQNMVGSDGKTYTVPANYASKSKLVEGDMLKLTITPRGSFIYKQIGPIERTRVIASLGFDQTIGEYYAANDVRRWSVLKASVTYYRGDTGDEVVLLVPKSAPSKWAAVENIIKSNPLDEDSDQPTLAEQATPTEQAVPVVAAVEEMAAESAPAEAESADYSADSSLGSLESASEEPEEENPQY